MTSHDEIVWLDEDGPGREPDDELPGHDRPGPGPRTRIVLGAGAALVLAAAVVAGIAGGDDDPAPTATRTVDPVRSSERAVATEPPLPASAPRTGLAAIRAAFPRAELTSFVAAQSPGTDGGVSLIYNLTAGRRLITVTVRPVRPVDREAVNRTATSVQIVQRLARSIVDVLVRVRTGAPAARDFAAVQQLVNDARLVSR